MKLVLSTALLFASLCLAHSRIFSRCDFARELVRQGHPRSQLNDWVCLAEHESGLNTQAINKRNVGGTWDYGIFQINSGYWCQGQKTMSNGCHINCDELLTDDITTASRCARQIYGSMGFRAWVAWNHNCQGRDLSQYTAGCGV